MYGEIPTIVFALVLLSLAIISTVKQSIEMYRATKQWQPNKYAQQLVSDGIIYFIVYISFHSLPSCSS